MAELLVAAGVCIQEESKRGLWLILIINIILMVILVVFE